MSEHIRTRELKQYAKWLESVERRVESIQSNFTRLASGSTPVSTAPPSSTTSTSATDSAAIHSNVSGEIAAIDSKVTPVAADYIVIEDTENSNIKSRITLGDIPVTESMISDLGPYLLIADIDDVPVDGATAAPISSNWADDHQSNDYADIQHLTAAQVAALHAVYVHPTSDGYKHLTNAEYAALHAVYVHPTGSGNYHITDDGTNNAKVLTASAVAGTFTWETAGAAEAISAVEGEATLDLTGLVTFLKDSAIRLYADVAKTKYWDVYGTLDDRLIIDYWDGTDYPIGLIWDYDGGTDPTFSFSNTRMVAKQFTTDNVVKISKFVDEDNMVSDSAVYVPTQQSVKAYVDGKDHDHATPIGVHAANPTNVNHLTDAQVAALHAVYTDAEALASSMEGIRIRPHYILVGNGASSSASYGMGYVRLPAADADCFGIWSFILPDHVNWNGGFKVVVVYNQSGSGSAYSVIVSVASHKIGITPVSQGWDLISSSTAYDFPSGTSGVMYENIIDLPSANSDQGDIVGVAIQSDASNAKTLDIYGVYLEVT